MQQLYKQLKEYMENRRKNQEIAKIEEKAAAIEKSAAEQQAVVKRLEEMLPSVNDTLCELVALLTYRQAMENVDDAVLDGQQIKIKDGKNGLKALSLKQAMDRGLIDKETGKQNNPEGVQSVIKTSRMDDTISRSGLSPESFNLQQKAIYDAIANSARNSIAKIFTPLQTVTVEKGKIEGEKFEDLYHANATMVEDCNDEVEKAENKQLAGSDALLQEYSNEKIFNLTGKIAQGVGVDKLFTSIFQCECSDAFKLAIDLRIAELSKIISIDERIAQIVKAISTIETNYLDQGVVAQILKALDEEKTFLAGLIGKQVESRKKRQQEASPNSTAETQSNPWYVRNQAFLARAGVATVAGVGVGIAGVISQAQTGDAAEYLTAEVPDLDMNVAGLLLIAGAAYAMFEVIKALVEHLSAKEVKAQAKTTAETESSMSETPTGEPANVSGVKEGSQSCYERFKKPLTKVGVGIGVRGAVALGIALGGVAANEGDAASLFNADSAELGLTGQEVFMYASLAALALQVISTVVEKIQERRAAKVLEAELGSELPKKLEQPTVVQVPKKLDNSLTDPENVSEALTEDTSRSESQVLVA